MVAEMARRRAAARRSDGLAGDMFIVEVSLRAGFWMGQTPHFVDLDLVLTMG
jgi:hypothetical protein